MFLDITKETASPKLTYSESNDTFIRKNLINFIEIVTGRRYLKSLYKKAINSSESGKSFWEHAFKYLSIDLSYDKSKLESIELPGPILLISNHPFGVIDGLAICLLASKIRKNFKVLTNKALCKVEMLEPYLLPIDFSGTKEALKTNINSRKEAINALRKNSLVAVFPAGGIATSKTLLGKAEELDWKLFTAKLIKKTKPTVIPIYFHGQNSRLFQLVSKISLTLRLSLLLREAKKKIGSEIKVTIGEPIFKEELLRFTNSSELMSFLKDQTLNLSFR